MKGAVKIGVTIGASVAITLAAIAAINNLKVFSKAATWLNGGN